MCVCESVCVCEKLPCWLANPLTKWQLDSCPSCQAFSLPSSLQFIWRSALKWHNFLWWLFLAIGAVTCSSFYRLGSRGWVRERFGWRNCRSRRVVVCCLPKTPLSNLNIQSLDFRSRSAYSFFLFLFFNVLPHLGRSRGGRKQGVRYYMSEYRGLLF